jgi:serine/threonine-protein kinase
MSATVSSLATSLQDRYRVERELGRGGMATVYLAHDLRHDRAVALKVLHPELAAGLGPERFHREIRLTARLQHPHILPILDSGESAGRLWYAMPFVNGESLRDLLRREVQLSVEQAVGIAREVAGALDHAHRQGIVHRDVKPENILLGGGHALVADFGLAKALEAGSEARLTETGLALGTPAYMSPEQSSGRGPLDGRSDIYALGCVLYEMLAGHPPFTGPTAQAILARHSLDPVPSLRTVRANVPPAVEAAVVRALAKVPADRFATVEEFTRALDQLDLVADPPAYRRRGATRRRLAAASAAVLAGLGVAGALLLRKPPVVQEATARTVAVLPFRVAGASPELAWLHEGLVDLLTIKLTGEMGPGAVEPRAVLSAWRRAARTSEDDVTPEAAAGIAGRLGAGRLIDGGVVGTPGHLTLAASLLIMPGARIAARVSVEGPADSLPHLVDRLAAQLLGAGAGVEPRRIASLTSSSLPAVRAYLDGRAEARRGRMPEAARRFKEAIRIDSTFALAGLALMRASIWAGDDGDLEGGRRVALGARDRLGPADRVLLDGWTAPLGDSPSNFGRLQAAVAAAPDRAELWYDLGDTYFHDGLLAGLDQPFRHAAEAFQRGWSLDSATAMDSTAPERSPVFAEPLIHMVEIAQMEGDTAAVRYLANLGLQADSAGRQAPYFRWHLAVAGGDSARRAFWRSMRGASKKVLAGTAIQIGLTAASSGVGLGDVDSAGAIAARLSESPLLRVYLEHVQALNRGRPTEALRTADLPGDGMWDGAMRRIRDALYWGGDTLAAAAAARRLARFVEAAPEDDSREDWYRASCALTHWRRAHRDLRGSETAIGKLRTAIVPGLAGDDSIAFVHYAELCAALLEAARSAELGLPSAPGRLQEADSLAQTWISAVCCGSPANFLSTSYWPGANLVIARLAEAQGDLPMALEAVRRRGAAFNAGAAYYLTTFLREEGRLAALTMDTAGAVRAYNHYLAFRGRPEPGVRPEVERVRTDLAQLLAEQPSP